MAKCHKYRWSESETEILINQYPVKGSNISSLSRSIHSIRRKASYLGLKCVFSGPKNPQWKGCEASNNSAHLRARIAYKCPLLKWMKLERHHIDDNYYNNEPNNIAFLSRKGHMKEDGRLDKLIIHNHNKSIIDNTIFMELYNQGLSDKQISDRLGVNLKLLWAYRERRKLPKHQRVYSRVKGDQLL